MSKYTVSDFRIDLKNKVLFITMYGHYCSNLRISKNGIYISRTQSIMKLSNSQLRELYNEVFSFMFEENITNIVKNEGKYTISTGYGNDINMSFFNKNDFSFNVIGDTYIDIKVINNISASICDFASYFKKVVDENLNNDSDQGIS